jgi:hypothetical protein
MLAFAVIGTIETREKRSKKAINHFEYMAKNNDFMGRP